jgi:glutaredoxin
MSKKAIVWSQPNCKYCDMAKTLLEIRGWEVEERVIGGNFTKEQFFTLYPGVRTVPLVILNNNWSGSFLELKELLG